MSTIKRKSPVDANEDSTVDLSKRIKPDENVLESECGTNTEQVDSGEPMVDHDLNYDADETLLPRPEKDEKPNLKFPTSDNREAAINAIFANASDGPKNVTKKQLRDACRSFVSGAMTLTGFNRCRLNWMTTQMYLFQMIGASWLRAREESSEDPHGGILADEMGLGKTIQMIANMVGDLHIGEQAPTRSEVALAKRRITLVVAPNAHVAEQWSDQIRDHCTKEARKVFNTTEYHAGARMKTTEFLPNLRRHHVIITTYDELVQQFKHLLASYQDGMKDKSRKKKKKKNRSSELYPFYKMKFHRIVLDEAQKISNHNTLRSKACIRLDGDLRWALTGTPIQNSLDELYPYFKFLKFPQTSDIEQFRQVYLRSASNGEPPILKGHLKRILLQRHKDDIILGRKLLDMEPCEIKTVFLDHNDSERNLTRKSEILARKQVAAIEKYAKIARLTEEEKKKRIMGVGTKLQMQTTSHSPTAHIIGNIPEPDEVSEDSFSAEDIDEWLRQAPKSRPASEEEYSDMQSEIRRFAKEFQRKKKEAAEESLDISDKKKLNEIHRKTIGKGTYKYKTVSWIGKGFPLILSTKLEAIVLQIKTWLIDDSDQKIVVFMRFIDIMAILAHALEEENIEFEMYHGNMNSKSRIKATDSFKEDPNKKVMIMSLMTGAVGLNLTCASRIIMANPWWNKGLEKQAYARIHRIGQRRKTEVVRFAMRDSMDERLIKVQENKDAEIDDFIEGGPDLTTQGMSADDVFRLVCGDISRDDTLDKDAEGNENQEANVEIIAEGDDNEEQNENRDSESEDGEDNSNDDESTDESEVDWSDEDDDLDENGNEDDSD